MKKRLRLHRETLLTLSSRGLNIARGGATEQTCYTTEKSYISCVECATDVGCGPDTNWMSACLECEI
jgi:hypothetical protein